jgi:hypothetical protein
MDDADVNLLTIDSVINADIEDDEESHREEPPKSSETLEMVRKMHILASS